MSNQDNLMLIEQAIELADGVADTVGNMVEEGDFELLREYMGKLEALRKEYGTGPASTIDGPIY